MAFYGLFAGIYEKGYECDYFLFLFLRGCSFIHISIPFKYTLLHKETEISCTIWRPYPKSNFFQAGRTTCQCLGSLILTKQSYFQNFLQNSREFPGLELCNCKSLKFGIEPENLCQIGVQNFRQLLFIESCMADKYEIEEPYCSLQLTMSLQC